MIFVLLTIYQAKQTNNYFFLICHTALLLVCQRQMITKRIVKKEMRPQDFLSIPSSPQWILYPLFHFPSCSLLFFFFFGRESSTTIPHSQLKKEKVSSWSSSSYCSIVDTYTKNVLRFFSKVILCFSVFFLSFCWAEGDLHHPFNRKMKGGMADGMVENEKRD